MLSRTPLHSISVRAVVLAAVTLAVVLGYSWSWSGVPVETADTASYYEAARDLEDFRLEEIHFRPPGYPLILRLLGFGEHRATRRLVVVGLAFHMLAVWILAGALVRLGLSNRMVGVFCAVLVLPPFVQPAAFVLSENLTQLLLAAAVAALARWAHRPHSMRLGLAGLALAAAALTKPTYQALAPALALCLFVAACWVLRWSRRGAFKASVVLVTVAVLPVLGFALFNSLNFGSFTLSPGNLAYSLSTKTVLILERLPDEDSAAREAMISARDARLVERGSSHTAEQYFPDARAAVGEATGLEGRELDDLMLKLNLKLIAVAPLSYALHVGRSVVSFWFPTVADVIIKGSPWRHLLWSGVQFGVFAGFLIQGFVLGGLAAFELSRRLVRGPRWIVFDIPSSWCAAYAFAVVVIVYTMAVSCLVHHGEPRFRSVTDPLIVFVCVLGSAIWYRLLKSAAARSSEAGPA